MNTLTPISVVIPTYNGQRLLEKHLPAVAKILDEGDEIIIADDASTDDTRAWVESQQAEFARRGIELKHVRSATNQRFAATCNMGIDAARHAHVFLLNNDVSPLTPNIKAKLLQWFDDPEVFAVGCAEVQSDEPNAKKSGRGTGDFQRGLLVHWYDPNQEIHQTLWAAGGSAAV